MRAIVFDRRGRPLSRARRPTPIERPRKGWSEFPAEDLWRAVEESIAEASAGSPQPSAIAGLAVASVGESCFPVDENGAEIASAIAWFDERTHAQLAWLEETVGRERLTAITGLAPDISFAACKILWMRDHAPALFEKARMWLGVADWVAWRLTGVAATDPTLASRTLLFDIARHDWSDEILARLELDRQNLPTIQRNGTPLGCVRSETAARLGLPATVIVAVGGHDHVIGALAAGAFVPGALLDSLGTAEALIAVRDEADLGGGLAAMGYAQGLIEAGERRIYVLGGLSTAGAALEWARASLLDGMSHRTMIELAGAAQAGSGGLLFVPHLHSSTMPNPDVNARGAIIGLSRDTGRSEIARAVHEGLALEARAVLDGMGEGGSTAQRPAITAIGGGVRNDLLMRIKASVYGRPIRTAVLEDATALGAAMLGGLGAGVYSDQAEATQCVEIDWREVLPEPAWQDAYDRLYKGVYRHAYDALRPLNHRLRSLEQS